MEIEIKKLMKMLGADRVLSQDDLQTILTGFFTMLSNFKKENATLNEETKKEVDDLLKVINIKQLELYEDIKDGKKEMIALHKEQCDELAYLVAEFKKIKPKDGKPGKKGKDADEERIISEVLQQIRFEIAKEAEGKQDHECEVDAENLIQTINDLDYSAGNLIDVRRIKGWNNLSKKSTKAFSPTVLGNAMDLDTTERADGYAVVWDETNGRFKFAASGGGGGGSGTVNSGSQYRLAYYATNGTAVSQLSAITADRVLISNANGLPTHSSVTTTTLAFLDATSSIQAQLDTKITASSTESLTNKTINASSNTISNLTTSMFAANVIDVDTGLSANSDSRLATQKAVKAYVDASVTGLLDLKGSTDCSTNPNYPSALKGDAYYVTVAGKIGGASGKTVEIGDVYVALADNEGGKEASVGTSWFVLNQNLTGVALTSGTLAQFASTTSSQLAGVISDETGSGALVFANTPTLISPILGTPTSGTLTNCTGLPISGLVASTSASIGVGSIELGHASDTTIARSAAGAVTIEGVLIVTETNTATMANKTLTTPVINGATLNGDIQINATPNTDDTWNGKSTNTFNAGGTIAQFDCVYLTSSSTWALTDADAIGTAGNVLIMMAGASGTNGNPLRVIEPGSWVRNDAWNWTVGGVLYLDTSVAGGLTQTAPSGEDDAVKIIGHAVTADVIYFNPSVNWIIAKA